MPEKCFSFYFIVYDKIHNYPTLISGYSCQITVEIELGKNNKVNYVLRCGSFISSGSAGHSVGRICNFLFGFILVSHSIVEVSGKAQKAESSHFLSAKDCFAQVARKKQGIKKNIICRL